MSSSIPQKRPRTTADGNWSSSRVAFELDCNISRSVSAREGHLRRVGNSYVNAQTVPIEVSDQWSQQTTWTVPDNYDYGVDTGHDSDDDILEDMNRAEDEAPEKRSNKGKRPRSQLSKRPNIIWKNLYRQEYLDEMLRWSGRGDFYRSSSCPECSPTDNYLGDLEDSRRAPKYRCRECFMPDLVCQDCCLSRHRLLPLHRIEEWIGERFIPRSLRSLGLVVQLNHGSMFCNVPVACHSSMIVIHTNGMHDVAFQYCGCERAIPPHQQLLRRGFYPASQLSVQTCATFMVMDLLHKFSLTTKAATYDFYRALEKMTSNTGLKVPSTRYRTLFRMNMQWRHLKMLKWAGRAQEPDGARKTQDGDLAIKCPSCPHPGINLPDDWNTSTPLITFLYALFVCLDANFRLKNQIVSNHSQNPGLGTGLAYIIRLAPYDKYVLSRTKDEDISTCVGLQALAQANTRNSSGLRYTGVGAASCGRSEMILPQGVGNLQKGERYANMDYVYGSAVHSALVALILVSYDIACQWFANLAKRMSEHWPAEIKPPDVGAPELVPAIPKLHHAMHERAGHDVYSLNLLHGAGNADLEAPERIWAGHNALANSTKTQGPGNRHDTLDDHFGFWNWLKYHGQGHTLAKKYRRALADRNVQDAGHRALTESLDDDLIREWTTLFEAWEAEPYPKASQSPYFLETSAMSEPEVTKTLLAEETHRIESGGRVHETSAYDFISIGLEIEELQRRVSRLAASVSSKKKGNADRQEGGLTDQRNQLRKKFRAWEALLPTFMPGLRQYQRLLDARQTPSTSNPPKVHPEAFTLWLPSTIEVDQRVSVCADNVVDIETRLRTAQAADALENVRHILKVKTRMIFFKNQNIRGQREGNRSRSIIDRIYDKVTGAAARYRASRCAMLSLLGPGEWENAFRVLLNKDIRGYQDPERPTGRKGRRGTVEDNSPALAVPDHPPPDLESIILEVDEPQNYEPTGETRRTLSWIWTVRQCEGSGAEADEDHLLRIEWGKSRARSLRATEEVILVKEEMRRVRAYLEWKAVWWEQRKVLRADSPGALREGLAAYAVRQANLQRELASSFTALWDNVLETQDLPDDNRLIDDEDLEEDADGDGDIGGNDVDDEEIEEDD